MAEWLKRLFHIGVNVHSIDDPNNVYIITTPYESGSEEIMLLINSINDSLESQGLEDVPVVILHKDLSFTSLSDKQLSTIGLVRK